MYKSSRYTYCKTAVPDLQMCGFSQTRIYVHLGGNKWNFCAALRVFHDRGLHSRLATDSDAEKCSEPEELLFRM